MNRRKAELRIELRSDLCAGSGYSYAGLVDSDVCYNENGVPYIPGRRLKGCLKEAGELAGIADIGQVFGVSGMERTMGISVGNAYPAGFAELNEELSLLRENEDYGKYLSEQKVLDQFCRVRAQTQIDQETGVASDNTLRYTRVVNQYSPLDGRPMEFTAEIEFDCDERELTKAVKALRHIGMDRNRGLGQVRCSLEHVRPVEEISVESTAGGAERVRLDYVLRNTQALMMSGDQDDASERYISGQSVLGLLAGAYLAQPGTSAEDEAFRDMFLNGKTIFTNLTLCRKEDGGKDFRRYIPAPLCLNITKKTKELVNLAAKEPDWDGFDPRFLNGNQLKKLNGKYVDFRSKDLVDIAEPEVEVVYHHSKKQKSRAGEDGILYAQEVLKEGQYFGGSIITERRYAACLKNLLEKSVLRFGRSKSAQYGRCRLVGEIRTEPYEPRMSIAGGDQIAVVLVSDAAFIGECGYTVRYPEVKKALADSLGLSYTEHSGDRVYMQAGQATGYHTVWNLKKPSVPVLGAGSVLEYEAEKDCVINTEFVGEKNLEGYGEVRIFRKNDLAYDVKAFEHSDQQRKPEPKAALPLLEKTLLASLAEELKAGIFNGRAVGISPSTLGRVTLMLEESLNQNREDSRAAWRSFHERISSIKRDKERSVIREYVGTYICVSENNEAEIRNIDKLPEYRKLKELGIDGIDHKISALWGDYLMQTLVYQKYLKKGDVQNGGKSEK